MAKITQLPKATAVTDDDIAVIVQEGETRQIPRKVLAPPAPDGIMLDGDTLRLSVDGVPIGAGEEIPVHAPLAKQIAYDRNKVEIYFEATKTSIMGKPVAELTVAFPVAAFTRNETEITSITPLLSDYRGIDIFVDAQNENHTEASISETCIDINEFFEGEEDKVLMSDLLKEADLYWSTTRATRTIDVQTVEQDLHSDGYAALVYTYDFFFDNEDTELCDAVVNEFLKSTAEYAQKFVVQFAEITCVKDAEVLK